jgi:iron complex outermembrane receptor protein
LELQDYWRISDKLNSSLIYTFTRAIIDKEDRGDGAFNGKDLPGVPEHGITASLNYNPWKNTNLNLSHTWRSSAYAINDFANDFSQRQISYNSTNLALNYQYKNMNWFTSIDNIFEHKNALVVQDNALYPVDFSRTWKVGMKADF